MIDETSFIPTKSALLKKEAADSFEFVVHESYKKKGSKSLKEGNQPRSKKDSKQEMDMKRARYEVFKFAMSGYTPQKKEEAKIALAVRLGAKPPKKPFVNYKELKVLKEKQRLEEAEEKRLLNAGKSSNLSGRKSTRKSKDGILGFYGRPGQAAVDSKRRKKHK
ncbi:uncharacterized protein C1orf131 isoform X2 [Anabrus simplex]